MSRHSSIVGGSTAGRLLECPGSYQAQLALPPSADVSSEYALEGTAMHGVMDVTMRARQTLPDLDRAVHAQAMLGYTFNDRKLTQDHLDTMILPRSSSWRRWRRSTAAISASSASSSTSSFPACRARSALAT